MIAGAGSNNTATAVELARSAERAGAQALLCVTPPYLKPTQAGMMVHFRTIHDAVGIPIILYDVPSRTACALDDVTIRRLAELPRIVGLKDATGDIPRVARLRRRLGDRVPAAVRRRCQPGGVPPGRRRRLHLGDGQRRAGAVRGPAPGLRRASRTPTSSGTSSSWRRSMPRCSSRPTRFPLKRALSRLGLMGDGLRLPLTPLSLEADRKLERVLKTILPAEEKEAMRAHAARGDIAAGRAA